jgi:hypothetical protein
VLVINQTGDGVYVAERATAVKAAQSGVVIGPG